MCDIVGTDLADRKQMVAVCDRDSRVLAPRTSPAEPTSTMARADAFRVRDPVVVADLGLRGMSS